MAELNVGSAVSLNNVIVALANSCRRLINSVFPSLAVTHAPPTPDCGFNFFCPTREKIQTQSTLVPLDSALTLFSRRYVPVVGTKYFLVKVIF